MKVTLHHGLSKSEWFEKTIFEQMANVGSEVFRAIKWQKKNAEYSRLAFERGVELLNLTIEDDKNENRQRELSVCVNYSLII